MLEFYNNNNLSTGIMMSSQHEIPITQTIGCNGRTDIATIKCEKNYEICDKCGQKIQDRYIMRMGDVSWHENCLRCYDCTIPLNSTCFIRDTKIYCKMDYERLFGRKCGNCSEILTKTDFVMRAQHYYYHLNCFMCCECNELLQKGEPFTLRSGRLYCKRDIPIDSYSKFYSDDYTNMVEDSIRHKDGRRGPKRPRTILTSAQRRQFKASFETSPKPCRKIREALAKDTGLSVRVVQVWFQNQRAKMKKIQRKSKQDGDKNVDKDGIKEEKGIKQESPNSDHGLYLNLDCSFNSSQPLNPNMPYSPDDYAINSDSDCSSDMSQDESYFDQLDDATSDTLSFKNLELSGSGGSGSTNNNNNNTNNNNSHHHHHDSISGLTGLGGGGGGYPIDKLLSMQNSYFSSDQ